MKKIKVKSIMFFMIAFQWLHCVSNQDSTIEEIGFLLDDGNFSVAVDKARQASTAHPENLELRFLLARSLLSNAVLGGNSNCTNPRDVGALGLLACLQEEQGSDETAFATFARVAPDVESKLTDLEESRDILIDLASLAQDQFQKEVYLQLYFARLFEIAGAVTRLGALSENEICNTNEASLFKDNVPDGFQSNALNSNQIVRYQDNLDTVNSDGQNAGLPSNFSLNDRVTSISSDLLVAINAAGDTATGASNFFNDQFNSADKALCTVPK